MDTKGAKNRDRIDLGLEAILAGAGTPRPAEVSIDLELPQGTREASPWTLGDAEPQPPKNEYESLADERKWGEIVRLAEERLAGGDHHEAKVWWIRGHLGAFSMPVSFLCAPFDALCHKLSPDDATGSFKTILEETGLLVLQRLREVGDTAHSGEVRSSLERLGIKEPRGGRERVGTSSFRSLESVALSAAQIPVAQELAPRVSSGIRKRVTWTGVSVLVVASLLALDRLFPHIRTPQLDIATESFEQPLSNVEQVTDTPGRRDPGGRLGTLFYSIGEGARTDSSSSPQVAPQPLVESKPRPEAKSEAPSARSKEEVNTRGPVEGPEFRERIERARPLAPQNRREEIQGGAPQAVLPGEPTREFDDHRTYRVLNHTSVLSAPSYGGRVIGQLETGDRVLVEGKLGRWLRLRSKKGRGGYVLTADVEEVPGLDSSSN